ncbi:MAG: high-affinity branched-chain amino acid ABC transporter permease LivM [Hyphomicrobiales bacterium]|nr:high-affinity branched-chain amino acid ABC transporter permease LivM [Hyphomicrobiales bacterium]
MAATEAIAASDAPRSVMGEALRDAGLAGLVAFILFGSLVGLVTEPQQEKLVLTYQWEYALGLALMVAAVRFLLDVFVWRRVVPVAAALPQGLMRYKRALLTALPALYILGGVLFLIPSFREGFGALGGSAGFEGEWLSRITTGLGLVSIAISGLFVLITGMLAARLVRIFVSWTRPQAGQAQMALTPQSLTRDLMSELAPALLIIALVLPLLVAGPQQRYAMDTAVRVVTMIMLGWGLNIVVGLAGLLDLGYVAFYAVGAYSYALIATEFGWSFWVCLPLAGIFAAFFGVMLGFPVLRLRGDYLAIVTLAFGEIIRIVLINWQSFTGGPSGINNIPQLGFFGLPFNRSDTGFHAFFGLEFNSVHRIIFFYYVILALALFTNFVTKRLRRLPIGRAWEALREDEIACRSLGINTVTTKLTAFAIGAMFAGFAGSFFATRQGFISPESFTFHESALVLAVVVLGGLGSQIGVVIASIALIGSSEFFRDLEEYRLLIFGACMVLLMTWRPRGLVSTRTPSAVLNRPKPITADIVEGSRA